MVVNTAALSALHRSIQNQKKIQQEKKDEEERRSKEMKEKEDKQPSNRDYLDHDDAWYNPWIRR